MIPFTNGIVYFLATDTQINLICIPICFRKIFQIVFIERRLCILALNKDNLIATFKIHIHIRGNLASP